MDFLKLTNKLENISILYLEDEEITRNTIKRLLEYYTDKVHVAENGIEAIKLFDELTFDLIITDLETPYLSGLEFISHVKTIDPHIPVIVFSAYTDKFHLIPCLNMNVQGFIEKPITFDKLGDVLSKLEFTNNENISTVINLFEDIKYDKANMLIVKNNKDIELTRKEAKFLDLFIDKRDEIISYDTIENHIWEEHELMTQDALRTFIKNLRKKTYKDIVKSVYGIGYKVNII